MLDKFNLDKYVQKKLLLCKIIKPLDLSEEENCNYSKRKIHSKNIAQWKNLKKKNLRKVITFMEERLMIAKMFESDVMNFSFPKFSQFKKDEIFDFAMKSLKVNDVLWRSKEILIFLQ